MKSTILLAVFAWSAAAQPVELAKGVNLYSLEKEQELGKSAAEQFRSEHKILENDFLRRYVERVGARLKAALPSSQFPHTFQIFADEPAPGYTEPSVLPGGYVFVPASLLLRAADEAEFAGLLAHAIVHVEARHGTKQATRGQIANLATIPLISIGDGNGIGGRDSASRLAPLGFLQYQRQFETQADQYAVGLLARAGFDPAGLMRYVERTQTQMDQTKVVFAKFPAKEDRLARLRGLIAETRVAASPAGTVSEDFAAVQREVRVAMPPAPVRPRLDPDAPPRLRQQ